MNESLIQYIKAVQAQGFPDTAIRTVLMQKGWKVEDIDAAFAQLLQPSMPVPPAPAGMAPNAKPAQAMAAVQPTAEQYNSPYSIGLAVIAFVSSLIVVNRLIDDITQQTTSINQHLVFDALIIIPFLVAAFLLHGLFSAERKRYLILSQPYFVVSGLLLIRLLWNTSKYILSANAVSGVYIVLVMVIVVLTGLIFFVRKYMIV